MIKHQLLIACPLAVVGAEELIKAALRRFAVIFFPPRVQTSDGGVVRILVIPIFSYTSPVNLDKSQ